MLVPAVSVSSQQDATKKPTSENVAYLSPGRAEAANLYLLAKRDRKVRSPAVVIVPGGGFTGGDKAAAREFDISEGGACLIVKGTLGRGQEVEVVLCPHGGKQIARKGRVA